MGLTQEIADYVVSARFDASHKRAFDIARMGITDSVATAFGGAFEDVSQITLGFAQKRMSTGEALVPLPWSLTSALPAPQAALVFGCAAHALDYDDVALAGHPSTVLTPAILTQGHCLKSSGQDCLNAYIVGYEVWAELFTRETDSLHIKGWHPTAVYGTIAATAALAYLRRVPQSTVATALAIAASLASGLVANFGTMTKPLHAGRTASLAFEAIELAELGLTAAPDALEHHAGFLNAISPEGKADRVSKATIGCGLKIEKYGVSIKKYPVCYSGHRVIDSIIDLVTAHAIRPDDVASVHAGIGPPQASMLRNHRPTTGLEAKFSLEFAVASALTAREVGLDLLTDEYVNRPDMRALYERINIYVIPELDEDEPTFSRHDHVRIQLKDGGEFNSGNIKYARGHTKLPLTDEQLFAKFRNCMARYKLLADKAGQNDYADSETLVGRFTHFQNIPDISSLFSR